MKSDESDEVEDMAAISFVLCMRGIKKYFDTHDTNGDGTITVAELKVFNEAMGRKLTDEEAKGIIKSVDTDQNGQLDLKEFVTGILNEFWSICLDDESEELFPKAAWIDYIHSYYFYFRASQFIYIPIHCKSLHSTNP